MRPYVIVSQASSLDTPWWVGLIVIAGLAVVAASLLAHSTVRRSSPPSRIGWKDHAERALAALRFLYDDASEDAALASNDRTEAIADLGAKAREHLYGLEASAPDNRVRAIAVECNEAAQELVAAFRARRDARGTYEESDGSDADARRAAREREVRASQALARSRVRLDAAIAPLSRIS